VLVSVLVPLYNKEKYIQKTLSSVINQTYPLWELIVVDDGSTDSSLKIALDYKNSLPSKIANRISILAQENRGQSQARYVAFLKAKGDFIALLDGDDLWSTKKLEVQVKYLESHPQIDLLLSNYCIFPEGGGRPKAVSFVSTSKRVMGWANTEYFGGLVESTGMFRSDFLRRHMSPLLPAMSGGLEFCLHALQARRIGCTKEYLCAYIENFGGWHLRKDDLISSIENLTRNSEILESTRIEMAKGLERHLFFWKFRQISLLKRFRLVWSLIVNLKIDYLTYALKTLSRVLVAQQRYFFKRHRIRDLRDMVA